MSNENDRHLHEQHNSECLDDCWCEEECLDSCCCKDSLAVALSFIKRFYGDNNVTIYSNSQLFVNNTCVSYGVTGQIDKIRDDFVKLVDYLGTTTTPEVVSYYTLCDIVAIVFRSSGAILPQFRNFVEDRLPPLCPCEDDCCCNQGIQNLLERIRFDYPEETPVLLAIKNFCIENTIVLDDIKYVDRNLILISYPDPTAPTRNINIIIPVCALAGFNVILADD